MAHPDPSRRVPSFHPDPCRRVPSFRLVPSSGRYRHGRRASHSGRLRTSPRRTPRRRSPRRRTRHRRQCLPRPTVDPADLTHQIGRRAGVGQPRWSVRPRIQVFAPCFRTMPPIYPTGVGTNGPRKGTHYAAARTPLTTMARLTRRAALATLGALGAGSVLGLRYARRSIVETPSTAPAPWAVVAGRASCQILVGGRRDSGPPGSMASRRPAVRLLSRGDAVVVTLPRRSIQ